MSALHGIADELAEAEHVANVPIADIGSVDGFSQLSAVSGHAPTISAHRWRNVGSNSASGLR
jgi:hypothetical protein